MALSSDGKEKQDEGLPQKGQLPASARIYEKSIGTSLEEDMLEEQSASTDIEVEGVEDEKHAREQTSTNNVDVALTAPEGVGGHPVPAIPTVDAPIPTTTTTANNLGIPPNSPTFFTALPLSQTQIKSESAKTTNITFPEIAIEKFFEKIKAKQTVAPTTSPQFTLVEGQGNLKEGTLTPSGAGAPVKIKEVNNEVQCTFTGSEGMRESAKVLLEAFIESGQTHLTIGGTDSTMVLILAELVKEKIGQAPNQVPLIVHLADDARKTLEVQNKDLVQKLDETKPAVASRRVL